MADDEAVARAIRATLREFLAAESDAATVLAVLEERTGFAVETWRTLAEQLGLPSVGLPAQFGGSGGLRELAVAVEETGRSLLCAPFLSTAVAAGLLAETPDDPAAAELLTRIGEGTAVSVALLPGMEVDAAHGPTGWTLTGVCPQVLDGPSADVVLVPATVGAVTLVFAAPTTGPGVARTVLPTLDQTRPQARLDLDHAPATLVGGSDGRAEALRRTADLFALLAGAEAVGGAERCLELAADHARQRVQFGRPIGSFQAVKQACADMLLDLETARSLVGYAVTLRKDGDPAAVAAASAVRLHVPAAFRRVAFRTVQVLGGPGVTWEHPAHLFVKRAKAMELLAGTPTARRAELAGRGPEQLFARLSGVAAEQAEPLPPWGAVEERVCAFLATAPDPREKDGRRFREAQFDAGLAWVHHPVGKGGLGLQRALQEVVDHAMAAAGAPRAQLRNPIGYGNAAPVLAAHGTEEQCARHLRACFSIEDVWCQLMSEPGAGSDVAGLSTRATWDGERWHVTGQKVWTSFAHVARWGLLVARTDPDVPKHRGITCFIVDMQAPGLDVRPIRMLTGKADFNEVYLDDVVLEDSARVGPVGRGWSVVRANLEGERRAFGEIGDGPSAGTHLLERWRDCADPAAETDRVLDAVVAALAAQLTAVRSGADATLHPAVVKLLSSESTQAAFEVALDLDGPAGTLHATEEYAFERPVRANIFHGDAGTRYLRSRSLTIEGGTSMILRNTLADQVLGLPKEPRVDVGVPWRDIPRTAGATRKGSS